MILSVAMTVYNGEMYLVEQLDSIRTQTIEIDDVVICDDVSSDNSVRIIQDYIKEYKLENKWHLHINEKNLGYADNFYKAMTLTKGDYIFLSDQDDIWISDRVEKMLSVMENNGNINMLGSEFEPYYCTEDAPQIAKSVINSMNGSSDVEHIKLNHNTIFIGSEGCTMCIRRTFFEEIQKYWYEGWAHDEYLWKMALCYDGCYIYHMPTLRRRLHSNNVSKRKMHSIDKRVTFLEALKKSHQGMLICANERKLEDRYIRLINKNIRSVDLRIELLRDRKVINTIILMVGYFKNYHSIKSIPVEFLMAIKGSY